jgi:hypothetical protein
MSGGHMARVLHIAIVLIVAIPHFPSQARAQGETTSAIVGEVRDATDAVVPGAVVTITNHETGLKRGARTDNAGRFNFPQLKPGTYSVKVQAAGFESQQDGAEAAFLQM